MLRGVVLSSLLAAVLVGCGGDTKDVSDSRTLLQTYNVKNINAVADKTVIYEGEEITFSLSDPENVASVVWEDETGELYSIEKRFTKLFPEAGSYTIKAVMETTDGHEVTDQVTITVNQKIETKALNQSPVVDAGQDKRVYEGEKVTLKAVANDPDGEIVSYVWQEGDHILSQTKELVLESLSLGEHIFNVTVTDDQGVSASDSVLVNVVQVPNSVPVATPKNLTLYSNESMMVVLSGRDPDGQSLQYTIVQPPKHGTLTNGVPNVVYTANYGYVGTDSFSYVVSDGVSQSDPVTVTFNIVPKVPGNTMVTIAQALLGPLSDAHFTVKRWDGTVIAEGQTTKGDGKDTATAGLIQIPSSVQAALQDDLYLVEVSGGMDIDQNDDRVWDTEPTENKGKIRAIVTANELQKGGFKVNIITELLYTIMNDYLHFDYVESDDKIKEDIYKWLNDGFPELFIKSDVDGDGDIDYDDILAWDPAVDVDKLKYSENAAAYQSLIKELESGKTLLPLVQELLGAKYAIYAGEDLTLDEDSGYVIHPVVGNIVNIKGYMWKEGDTALSTQKDFDTSLLSVGTHTLKFLVILDTGAVLSDYVNVEILPVNHAPVAENIVTNVRMNTAAFSSDLDWEAHLSRLGIPPMPTRVDILLKGTDVDGDQLTYEIVEEPTHGKIVGTLPNIKYIPEKGYLGSDSFSYKVNDGSLDSNIAKVNIEVKGYGLVKQVYTSSETLYTYDKDTKKVSITSDFDNDGVIDRTILYYYNDNGDLLVKEWISSSSHTKKVYEYNEDGTLASEKYYPDVNNDYTYIVTYSYDEQGNRIERLYKNTEGSSSRYKYYYNDNNLLVKMESYSNGKLNYVQNNIYNEKEQLIRRETDQNPDDAVVDTVIELQYDDNGNKIKEIVTRDTYTLTYNYTYNAYNALIKKTSEHDGYENATIFTYDDNGNVIEMKDQILYPDGTERTNIYTYAYDSQNNLVKFDDGYSSVILEWKDLKELTDNIYLNFNFD